MLFSQPFDVSFPEDEAIERTAAAYEQACRRTEGGEPEPDYRDRMRIDRDVPPPPPVWKRDETGALVLGEDDQPINLAPDRPVQYLVRVNH